MAEATRKTAGKTRTKAPSPNADQPLPPVVSVTTALVPVDKDVKAAEGPERALLDLAVRQFQSIATSTGTLRADMLDDIQFTVGQIGDKKFQYPEGIAEWRRKRKLPILQANRMPGFVALASNPFVEGDYRITVKPVEDGDTQTAEVLQAIIRNAEVRSRAHESAYPAASRAQCRNGLGVVRFRTEYVDKKTRRQRIKYERVLNVLRLYVEFGDEADWADSNYGFWATDLNDEQYKARFKKDPPVKGTQFQHLGDDSKHWFPRAGHTRIAEWFNREIERDYYIYFLKSGEPEGLTADELETKAIAAAVAGGAVVDTTNKEAVAAIVTKYMEQAVIPGPTGKRLIVETVMRHRLIDIENIHEESVCPADCIPFAPMIGEEDEVDGERVLKGVVRDGKDPHRNFNVLLSRQAQVVGMGTLAPYIGYKGMFGKPGSRTRKNWERANEEPLAFLEVEEVTVGGKPAPYPNRSYGEAPIAAINAAIVQADQDMKSTMRFHEASLAQKGPQESGVAITARQQQDQLANSLYTKNAKSGLAALGRMSIKAIRQLYDQWQVVRVTGKDNSERNVVVFMGKENDPRVGPNGEAIPFPMPKGVKEGDIYDVGVGEYDVEVSGNPDPGTEREQQLMIITEIFKMLPPEFAVKFLDLQLSLIDSAIGRKMADRAKRELGIDDDDNNPKKDIPPQVQAQLQQLTQQHAQLMKLVEQLQDEKRVKRLDLASRENINALNAYVKLVTMLVGEEREDRRLLLQTQIQNIQGMLDRGEKRLDAIETSGGADAPQLPGAGELAPPPAAAEAAPAPVDGAAA